MVEAVRCTCGMLILQGCLEFSGWCVVSNGVLCVVEVADVQVKEVACVLVSKVASVLVGVFLVVEVACLWLTYCGSVGRNKVLMGVVFGVGNRGVLGLG